MKQLMDRVRIEAGALLGSALAFVVFFVLAARAYPGGTHFDHASRGHDFWRNTLCDVARTMAIDGRPNASACTLARVAMITLALGLGVLFAALPRLFPARPRLGTCVRLLGAATVPFAVAVVLLPTDRFGHLHGVAIVLAGTLGLSALLLALAGLFAEARAPRHVVSLGVITMSVAAVDFALYVVEFASQGPAQLAVPVLERLATLLVLAWMAAVARAVHRLRVPSLDGGLLAADLRVVDREIVEPGHER
ncbi:MAG TPA: hypothetical protein VLT33_37245 [Labilithrix sp.]|nr:hypothetical protein [Labilithrix sp.]